MVIKMSIFDNPAHSEPTKEHAGKNYLPELRPFIAFPYQIIPKDRQKILVNCVDDAIGQATTENLQNEKILDHKMALNLIHDTLDDKEISVIEYTFMIQILNYYVFHMAVTGVPLNLKKLI